MLYHHKLHLSQFDKQNKTVQRNVITLVVFDKFIVINWVPPFFFLFFLMTAATTPPRCCVYVCVIKFALQTTSPLYLLAHCVRGVEGAAREHKRKGAALGLGVTLSGSGATSKTFRGHPPTLNQHRDGESL